MENTPKITIEDLAVKLNGKMWTKGDLKRIYLDRGYNTKKMSTKTYVFEKEGRFIVVCNVECDNQPTQWCDSQEAQVIEEVESEIETALVTDYYLVLNNDTAMFVDDCGTEKPMNDLYGGDIYFFQKKAEKFIEKELNGNYSVQLISRESFDRQVEELDKIEKANYVAPVVEEKVIEKPVFKSTITNTETPTFGVNTKVKHSRFGIGVILAEDDERVDIEFTDGKKNLLKRFANLQKVD